MQPSLESIPAELRLLIFRHLLTGQQITQPWGFFHIFDQVVDVLHSGALRHRSKQLAIMRCNTLFHAEISNLLYSAANVTMVLTGGALSKLDPVAKQIGAVEDLIFWPYLYHIKLQVTVPSRRHLVDNILQYARCLVATLNKKKNSHLKVAVNIDWADHEPEPKCMDRLIKALGRLNLARTHIQVHVRADVEEEDATRIEEALTTAISSITTNV